LTFQRDWVARRQARFAGCGRRLWPRLSEDVYGRSLVVGR